MTAGGQNGVSDMKRKPDRSIVRIFAGASFLQDLGSEMVFSIWPLFVTVFFRANLVVLGFIDGIGTAMVSISQSISGYASDRLRKRKVFIWTGYLMGGISKVGYALAPAWQWLIPFKLMDRGGKIRGAPRDAMLADACTRKDRGAKFGILRAMDNLGAVCGIISSFFLLGLLGFLNMFLLAAIPSVLAALLILMFLKERKRRRSKDTCDPPKTAVSFWAFNSNYRSFTMVSFVFALGNFSYSFLLIFAYKFGMSTEDTILLYLLFNLVAMMTSYPFGLAADRVGRRSMILVAYISFLMVCIGLVFTSDLLMLIVFFIFYGLFLGAFEPVHKAFVSELATPELKASGLGFYQMVIGLTSLPASFIAGILWELFGKWAPFTFSALVTTVACIGLLFVKETGREG